MKRVLVAGVVAAVFAVSSACSQPPPLDGQARLQVGRDSVVHTVLAGRSKTIRGSHLIASGTEVRVSRGSAVLDLTGGGTMELRTGSQVRVGRQPRLLAGEALVVSSHQPVVVQADGTDLAVDGVGRLSRQLAVTASTYRGVVTVESAGRSLAVPALRRATVPDFGVLPHAPVPLALVDDDWDRRYLLVAIDLSRQLTDRANGFAETPSTVLTVFPSLMGVPLGTDGREALVGAGVVEAGTRGTAADRWRTAFAFRNQGAAWGLVVLDQRVGDPYEVLQLIQDALLRLDGLHAKGLAFSFAAGAPGGGGSAAGPSAPPSAVTPVAPPPQSPGPAPSPTPTTTPPLPVPVPVPTVPLPVPLPPLPAPVDAVVQQVTTSTTVPSVPGL